MLTRNLQPLGPRLVRGEAVHVWDSEGRRYLDFCGQTLNLNLGHRHPEVVKAIKDQADVLLYGSSRFWHPPAVDLATILSKILPQSLNRLNLKMVSGSEANEGALKAMRKVHGGPTVAGFHDGFLGVTFETMKASGKYFNLEYLGDQSGYIHVPPPVPGRCPYHSAHDECGADCARWLEEILDNGHEISGILIEPILVDTGGVIIPPRGYLDRLRKTCTTNDVALAFDEDQTACGWLGTWFASDYFGVVPDLMTFGKGLASGMPLNVLACRERYDVLEYGEHEFTTGANPLCCAAAVASLRVLGQPRFLDEVARLGDHLRKRLTENFGSNPRVRLRCAGLLAGLEILDDSGAPDAPGARAIFDACLKAGILVRLSNEYVGNVLVLKPPVIITLDQIDEAVATITRCVAGLSA